MVLRIYPQSSLLWLYHCEYRRLEILLQKRFYTEYSRIAPGNKTIVSPSTGFDSLSSSIDLEEGLVQPEFTSLIPVLGLPNARVTREHNAILRLIIWWNSNLPQSRNNHFNVFILILIPFLKFARQVFRRNRMNQSQ